LSPPFGSYTATSAQLAGSFRHAHSRLAEFAEEIAFFGGEETEKMLLEREYATGVVHENLVLRSKQWHGCLEEVRLIRYHFILRVITFPSGHHQMAMGIIWREFFPPENKPQI
jgi:ABC-type uncharacterized transport system fused permease/ATPase subunit